MASDRELYQAAVDAFVVAAREMTSVRVADGHTPHSASVKRRSPGFVPVLFTEDDPEALDELRVALAVRPQDDGGNWMEPGSPTLTLVAGQRDLVSVILIDGTYLRFHDVAVWDAPLRAPDALGRWLSQRVPRDQ